MRTQTKLIESDHEKLDTSLSVNIQTLPQNPSKPEEPRIETSTLLEPNNMSNFGPKMLHVENNITGDETAIEFSARPSTSFAGGEGETPKVSTQP